MLSEIDGNWLNFKPEPVLSPRMCIGIPKSFYLELYTE